MFGDLYQIIAFKGFPFNSKIVVNQKKPNVCLEMNDSKRQRTTWREERKDRLHDLPNCLLLHIMNLLDTKRCVSDLCCPNNGRRRIFGNVSLISLSAANTLEGFNIITNMCLRFCLVEMVLFTYWILSWMPSVWLCPNSWIWSKYAHHVQELELTVVVDFNHKNTPYCFDPIFSC